MDKQIPYQKCESKQDAFNAVKEAITPETIEKFKVHAELEYLDSQDKITAKGKGFDLAINFLESGVGLDLSLSFMLKPFKSKIIEGLEKQLTRII